MRFFSTAVEAGETVSLEIAMKMRVCLLPDYARHGKIQSIAEEKSEDTTLLRLYEYGVRSGLRVEYPYILVWRSVFRVRALNP